MTEAVDFINKAVRSHACIIFGKSYCPYTLQTKDLLLSVGGKCSVVDLDQVNKGQTLQMLQTALYQITNQKTVPNIFMNRNHIGGASDVMTLYQQKKLLPLLMKSRSFMDLRQAGTKQRCPKHRHLAATSHMSTIPYLYEGFVRSILSEVGLQIAMLVAGLHSFTRSDFAAFSARKAVCAVGKHVVCGEPKPCSMCMPEICLIQA